MTRKLAKGSPWSAAIAAAICDSISTAAAAVSWCNARFARDPAPLQKGCECPACKGFSRAYLRHLVNQQELLGHRLLSLHNLRFLLDLTAGARASIERGEFAEYKRDALARLGTSAEEEALR